MSAAIEVSGLSKRFTLYEEKYNSLKERLMHAGRVPHHDFWALRGIELEVLQGDTLGILGRNGSGKSTLLKCIAGILAPTEGEIRLRGQLAAMLELGAGFQPDLSGRDNIYLNASLLGMSRREIDKSFDAIVAFAELEEFIENQVRFYSSGMYVRLGFAVAVNCDPDILLVDEVLAVGDERFQQKCMGRIHEFQDEGRTIVVVSHAADVMRQLCNKVAVIDSSELLTVAAPGEAISRFRQVLIDIGEDAELPGELGEARPAPGSPTPGPLGVRHNRRVSILASRCSPGLPGRERFRVGDTVVVEVDLEIFSHLGPVAFGCSVFAGSGAAIFDCETTETFELPLGRSTVSFRFPALPLLDGAYTLNVRIQDPRGGTVHARLEPAAQLVLENLTTATGMVNFQLQVDVAPTSPSASSVASAIDPAALVDNLST